MSAEKNLPALRGRRRDEHAVQLHQAAVIFTCAARTILSTRSSHASRVPRGNLSLQLMRWQGGARSTKRVQHLQSYRAGLAPVLDPRRRVTSLVTLSHSWTAHSMESSATTAWPPVSRTASPSATAAHSAAYCSPNGASGPRRHHSAPRKRAGGAQPVYRRRDGLVRRARRCVHDVHTSRGLVGEYVQHERALLRGLRARHEHGAATR